MIQLLKEMRDIKDNLVQQIFHQRMDTVDLSKYFPLSSDADIDNFMKEDHEWKERKRVRSYISSVPEEMARQGLIFFSVKLNIINMYLSGSFHRHSTSCYLISQQITNPNFLPHCCVSSSPGSTFETINGLGREGMQFYISVWPSG